MRSTRAARLGATFAVLDVLHDVADHIVQTDAQADPVTGKAAARGWVRPMAGHVGGYHAVQVAGLLALRGLGVRPSARRTLAAVALSAVTHAFLDRRWPVKALLRGTGSPRFAEPQVQVEVRGSVAPAGLTGRAPIVEAEGRALLPLHGPYLADQAAHRLVLIVAAGVIAW